MPWRTWQNKRPAMNKEVLETIYEARWLEWKKEVIDSVSTPVLLLSMGNGENIGILSVSTCEDVNDEVIEALLIQAWWDLNLKRERG